MNSLNRLKQQKNKNIYQEIILVFLGLLVLSIAIKLPSFFRYLDLPDEATFILMAQSIIDGHLPYTELWDIKLPLGFFVFTLPIILFGKSLFFVRLYASIYIALAGLAVYLLGKRVWNRRTGIIGATLLTIIVALGTNPGRVMEMTTLQQIALAPLTASLTVVATTKINPNGVSAEIAEYFKQENYSGEPIFMLNSHIVYWFLNTRPLSKSTTQPYNIVNSNLLKYMAEPKATTESEFTKILAQEPKYIVAKGGFRGQPGILFKKALRDDYELVNKIQAMKIYRRKSN